MSSVLHPIPPAAASRVSRPFSRRDFMAGAGALAAGLTLDSGMIARHDFEVVSRPLKISRLPEAFNGYRIVQLSDIHLEEFTEATFLEVVVHRTNLLKPDMVLITGDFASRSPLSITFARRAIERCAEVLAGLYCPVRYGILGNHDTGIGSDFVLNTMRRVGLTMLVNQYVPIEREGQRFWLGGVDDPGTSNPILDLAVPQKPEGPVILMCHPPDFADDVVKHPRGQLVDVMLSGHSHGGQIRLPFVGAMVLPPMGEKYVAGLFRFSKMQLYVNRGIGTVGLPFRLNCPPEITVHQLETA
jgi:predicted MPP superfamily phosphohydrolase